MLGFRFFIPGKGGVTPVNVTNQLVQLGKQANLSWVNDRLNANQYAHQTYQYCSGIDWYGWYVPFCYLKRYIAAPHSVLATVSVSTISILVVVASILDNIDYTDGIDNTVY